MNTFNFEDININTADNKEEMKIIFSNLIKNRNTKYISFINPEIFLQQQKNIELHNYFKNATYNFIDGIGLLYAINKKLGTKYNILDRYPGTDFFDYLPNEKIKVFLYGGKPNYANIAKEKIESKFNNISIVDTMDGYNSINESDLIQKINSSSADILIICIGCPKQELWIRRNLNKLSIPLIFGNGGAIDFWSGSVKRAPKFMINCGLEWIFRLFQNFTIQRIKRQSKLFIFLLNYKRGKYNIEKIE